MTKTQRYTLGLGLVMILFSAWHFYALAPKRPERDLRLEERQLLSRYYLAVKDNLEYQFEGLENLLKSFLATDPSDPIVGEAVALIYGLEGKRTLAEQVIDRLDKTYNPALLRHVLGYGTELPENWREHLEPDWAGAKMKEIITDGLDDRQEHAQALIALRHLETQARRRNAVDVPLSLVLWVGLGLLVSMFLSQRHWKRFGKSYFQLTPLDLPFDTLLRFCGYFLLGFLAGAVLSSTILQPLPPWLRQVIVIALQIAWGVYLLRSMIFPGEPSLVAAALGLKDLKMRFWNIFQIFGGFAIILAGNQLALYLVGFIDWPLDRLTISDAYRATLQEPLAGGVYMMTACILAPLFEEIFFRGLIFRALLSAVKPWQALIGSSLLFMVLHPIEIWPLVFVQGYGLALVYYRTANILVVVWTHALWNCAVLALTVFGLSV